MLNQARYRLLFQHHFRIIRQVVEHPIVADHKPAIHVGLLHLRLLVEAVNAPIFLNFQRTKSSCGVNCGNGTNLPAFLVSFYCGVQIDVG